MLSWLKHWGRIVLFDTWCGWQKCNSWLKCTVKSRGWSRGIERMASPFFHPPFPCCMHVFGNIFATQLFSVSFIQSWNLWLFIQKMQNKLHSPNQYCLVTARAFMLASLIVIPFTILEISKFLGQLLVDDDDKKSQLNLAYSLASLGIICCADED